MEDLVEFYTRLAKNFIKGDTDKWRWQWLEELKRRSDIELNSEDDEFLKELKFGPVWICPKCGMKYRVKTPFCKLYCSECLNQLKCLSLIPRKEIKPGYWVLEDDRRGH